MINPLSPAPFTWIRIVTCGFGKYSYTLTSPQVGGSWIPNAPEPSEILVEQTLPSPSYADVTERPANADKLVNVGCSENAFKLVWVPVIDTRG